MKKPDQKPNRDPFEQEVLKKLEDLNIELQDVRRQIDELEKRRLHLRQLAETLIGYVNATEGHAQAKRNVAKLAKEAGTEPITRLSRTKAARQVLYPARRFTTDELFRVMRSKGYQFKSRRPKSDLSAALDTSPHFAKDEQGKWYLVDPNREW